MSAKALEKAKEAVVLGPEDPLNWETPRTQSRSERIEQLPGSDREAKEGDEANALL